jgi:hypothetical protein
MEPFCSCCGNVANETGGAALLHGDHARNIHENHVEKQQGRQVNGPAFLKVLYELISAADLSAVILCDGHHAGPGRHRRVDRTARHDIWIKPVHAHALNLPRLRQNPAMGAR